MIKYSKNRINTITKIFFIIIIFVSFEDFIRRIFRDIPASIMVLKTFFLFIVTFYYKIAITPSNYKDFLIRVTFLLLLIVIPNITSEVDFLRAMVWFNAVIIIPILITSIMIKIGDDNAIKIFKGIFIITVFAGIFAAYNYLSGKFTNIEDLGGPVVGGYRFFEGQRLYFNPGWFFGAERLSWFCAIGISAGFVQIINLRKSKNQIIYMFLILFLLFVSYSTGRVTGFLMATFVFLTSILVISLKSKKWLPLITITTVLLVFYYQDIFHYLRQDVRVSFIIEHSSSVNERGISYLDNIKNTLTYAGLTGVGPLPQGLQYLNLKTYESFYFIQSEGLLPFSLLQFGVLSIIHLIFNSLFILLALRAILKYDDYKIILGLLLLALKIWNIKASQIETDTFAQFFLYIMIAPLIKYYFEEMKHPKNKFTFK